MKNDLARMFEIDCDPSADDRLNLPLPPFGPVGMAHNSAHFKESVRHG